jgi:hypothetical protein
MITKLLHDITQAGYRVVINDFFEGMITITFYEELSDEYIRHEHLSYPGGSMEDLDLKLKGSLEQFQKEIKEANVRRDGLATPKKD